MRRIGRVGVGVTALVMLPVLAACGSTSNETSDTGTKDAPAAGASTTGSGAGADSSPVTVVASTDVWGDITKQIAGSLAGSTVQISSIITDPDADPHTYEANAQTQLALSRAAIVIENGGGYDDFVTTMVKGAGSKATVLDAVEISGRKAPAGGELNEHVWYDFPTVQKVAGQIVTALSQADPANASTYQANEQAFDQELQAMETTEAAIKASDAGDGVAITEPVPLYLLEACGLTNKTPSDFSEAIEEDSDVPAAALKQTLDLFDEKQVKLLAYNEQTSGPITERVLKAAKANDVAVVPVTETLPEGKDYLTWMQDNLSAIKTALD
jgi:zinc/manganese transport system substrate-binding protein